MGHPAQAPHVIIRNDRVVDAPGSGFGRALRDQPIPLGTEAGLFHQGPRVNDAQVRRDQKAQASLQYRVAARYASQRVDVARVGLRERQREDVAVGDRDWQRRRVEAHE